MRILITGGGGFLGQRVAATLLCNGIDIDARNRDVDSITLTDLAMPAKIDPALSDDQRVSTTSGDLTDSKYVKTLFECKYDCVFHLASIVSSHGEQDFDLALAVNLDATRAVFEACRAQNNSARVVFTSSLAAFGGEAVPDAVTDTTKQTATTTYGITKTIGELLVNEYSRKGFFDGRTARLPTVIIRPGKPNKAASSFVSGLFREPLAGEDCVIPVDPNLQMAVTGYRSTVEGMIKLAGLPARALGGERALGLPSLNVTVQDMINALKNATTKRSLGQHIMQRDPTIEQICGSWPNAIDGSRALALGMPVEKNIEEIVHYYIQDYHPAS